MVQDCVDDQESLAYSFEGVNLYEDALVVYEELEAAFIQVVKEQNLSWFGKLGATGSRDDSLAVLDTAAKPYRELLQTSSISIFDFRVYVFARQALLLGKLGRITEIAKRGQWFVASLARRLRENEVGIIFSDFQYGLCLARPGGKLHRIVDVYSVYGYRTPLRRVVQDR